MSDREIRQGEIYRHFKDKLYQITAIAYHSETGEKFVVYQALYGDFKTYIRPYDMFVSKVDTDKYPDVKQKYRFEKIESNKTEPKNTEVNTDKEIINEDKIKEEEQGVNPLLLNFFDVDTYADKVEYIKNIRNKMDDRLINDIAASMDITVESGDIDTRTNSLINCLRTMARFETNRLR